jgi:hypothetical protein
VFGYGCSVEEHVKYGLCLDGMCGRRAKWEDVTLLTQDRGRLGHGGGGASPERVSPPATAKKQKQKQKASKGGSGSSPSNRTNGCGASVSVDMHMSRRAFNSIEDLRKTLQSEENPDFSPLKTASLRGDFDTVVQLCLLGADINERDR